MSWVLLLLLCFYPSSVLSVDASLQLSSEQLRTFVCTLAANATRQHQRHSSVVDIGCRTGEFLVALKSCEGVDIPDENIFGIDTSEADILKAQAKFGDLKEHFFVGSLDRNIFAPDTFSIVSSFGSFSTLRDMSHARQVLSLMERFRRKPSGVILIADIPDADKPNADQTKSKHLHFTKTFFKEEFAIMGLEHVCIDEDSFDNIREFYPPAANRFACIAWHPQDTINSSITHNSHRFEGMPSTASPQCKGSSTNSRNKPTYTRFIVRKVCFETQLTKSWALLETKKCRSCKTSDPLMTTSLPKTAKNPLPIIDGGGDCSIEAYAVPSDFCKHVPLITLNPLYPDCEVDCLHFRKINATSVYALIFEPRVIPTTEWVKPSSHPSFSFFFMDAVSRGLIDKTFSKLLDESAEKRDWIHVSFSNYSVIGFNTFPNTVSLLSGFNPPNVTVQVTRYGSKDPEPHLFPDVYACAKEYSSTHMCSPPIFEEQFRDVFRNKYHTLFHAFQKSHMSMFGFMWSLFEGEYVSSTLFKIPDRNGSEPTHYSVGPFENPDGYGKGLCSDYTIRVATWLRRQCLSGIHLMDLEMDFTLRFLNRYSSVPTFSFDILFDTHDDADAIERVKLKFKDFISLIPRKRMMFFALGTDHGKHQGTAGRTRAHHSPDFHLLVPKEFAKEYPKEMQNLLDAKSLGINHRDVYWTVRDIDALVSGQKRPEIPPESRSFIRTFAGHSRSCADAGIINQYCGWFPL